MSLAMYASEFNNEENNNPIQKKREGARNKTLKRRDTTRSNAKVEAMLEKIHEADDNDENDDNNYQPIQPPSSAGMERMEHGMEHGMEQRMDEQQNISNDSSPPQQEAFTQLPSEYAKQYYQQYIPYYNQSSDDMSPTGVNKDELLTKLNQVIYLLEEQQNEKTGHVTEELILYSFLGIFIIFIVDSFARVGKYVR
jgi:hypothetical protein|tara:strand:- start:110 stop:697 length:588 start_codon:yes stop_codon:yes gene_type:complete